MACAVSSVVDANTTNFMEINPSNRANCDKVEICFSSILDRFRIAIYRLIYRLIYLLIYLLIDKSIDKTIDKVGLEKCGMFRKDRSAKNA